MKDTSSRQIDSILLWTHFIWYSTYSTVPYKVRSQQYAIDLATACVLHPCNNLTSFSLIDNWLSNKLSSKYFDFIWRGDRTAFYLDVLLSFLLSFLKRVNYFERPIILRSWIVCFEYYQHIVVDDFWYLAYIYKKDDLKVWRFANKLI